VSQPIDLVNAQNTLQNAQTNLDKAYSDAFTAISNSFLNLPNIMTALNDILYSDQISSSEPSLGSGQINTSALLNSTYETDKYQIMSYQSGAENDYATAKKNYDDVYQDFRNASVYSASQVIENLLAKTLAANKAVAQAIKSENNYLTAWSDSRSLRNSSVFSQVATYKTNLSTYSGQVNTITSNLSSAQTTIKTCKDAITTANNNLNSLTKNQPLDLAAAEASLKEKQASLADLMAGVDPLDIKTQELAVEQRRNSLYDAQNTLADYTIKAPFDGVIAAINVKVGDSAGSAAIATIVTKQQIAEISLNEVDAAKIKVGMKATMTFDAIDGLEITGKVAELDTIGTVTQGVVTYNVKIVFDTQDDRVKPGMSTNTTIITDSKTDVLSVESSAIKTDNNSGTYVQILDASGQLKNVTVQTGISNDTNTEIISGLNEGDKVVTQTINSGVSKTTTTTTTQKSGNVGGFIMGGAH
jgi:RND family efflux transporter MFP subunit